MSRVPNTNPANRGRDLEVALGFCLFVLVGTIMYIASTDLGILGWIGGVAFGTAFGAIPYVVAYFSGRLLYSRLLRYVAITMMFGALGWWLHFWYIIFIEAANPDAQDGLILIFAPLYSGFAVFVGGMILKLIDRWI